MIDGRKIFPDVAFEHVAIKLQKMLIAANSAMGAFSDAISIRIKDKASLKQRADNVDESMMHNAVAKRRGTDHARLRFVNLKCGIFVGLIGLIQQLFLQAPKIFFK